MKYLTLLRMYCISMLDDIRPGGTHLSMECPLCGGIDPLREVEYSSRHLAMALAHDDIRDHRVISHLVNLFFPRPVLHVQLLG